MISRITAGLNRRACCADSSRILSQRACRLLAAATSALSLRDAAIGKISVAPSSVAFSRHHSNRSNFTSEISNWIRSDGSRAGNRLNQRELHAAVASLRQRHIFHARQPHPLPVAQLVELPRLGAQHAAKMLRGFPAKLG